MLILKYSQISFIYGHQSQDSEVSEKQGELEAMLYKGFVTQAYVE